MGSILSSASERGRDSDYVTCESETINMDAVSEPEVHSPGEQFHETSNEDEDRARAKEAEMNEFRKQLSIKREQRKEILARHRSEKEELEKALKDEKTSNLELIKRNEQLRDLLLKNEIIIPDDLQSSSDTIELSDTILQMKQDLEKLKADNNKLRRDLVDANNSLQGAYSDIADLNGQNLESIQQIHALKEVVSVSKTLMNLREGQLNDLKDKLVEIERSLADRESNMLSVDLRQEYERQLQNIRTLRGLYEERARLAEVTRRGLARDLEEQKALYQLEATKSKDLVDKIEALEENIDTLKEIIDNKNDDISACREETIGLKSEMAVVNKLFSQVLLGYKTKQDLDKLVHRLEENHGLLTHMAGNENDAEASSALPKLLLELVSQVDDNEENPGDKILLNENLPQEEPITAELLTTAPPTSAKEIVENLPKVWRVLMELLSHQSVVDDTAEKVTTCYKSVETKTGPVLVPSVSQTYIRLKDLIVEKLGLVKEMNRMKQLNSHLENRLQEQEKRLCLVTTELSKTWHVVGKLRRHHYQLHTHEKILKYELQQKRKLLNELKEELEYCREKWDQAREKNTQSEKDWRILRAEFSSRKTKSGSPTFNNSGESGYSDERPTDESSESNDESEYVAESVNRCKKKLKKSFGNVLDSSADFNSAAEREDPVSDMIDVADLPLDTQDGHEVLSEYSKSESVFKSEKTCETEDEIGDLTHDDLCIEQASNREQNNCDMEISTQRKSNSSSPIDDNITIIDPATILSNIRKQNERLTKKDERMEMLEKSSAALLQQAQTTTKKSDEINQTLDHLINRPTCSSSSQTPEATNQSVKQLPIQPETLFDKNRLHHAQSQETGSTNITKIHHLNEEPVNINSSVMENDLKLLQLDTNSDKAFDETSINFKTILENVKLQKEKLAMKDERLQKLEIGCEEVVRNLATTLSSGEEIVKKLDDIHNVRRNVNPIEEANANISNANFKDDFNGTISDTAEPSTSSEMKHEAIFAARDLRLKMLEEQTKNLVKKVNKTNSKGVKIHYKLEELHNIYGSESSRAGTPSEDTEENSIDDDDNGDVSQ